MDPTVYVRNITPDGVLEVVNSYNAPVVPEQIITGKIQIIKHTNHGATQIETPEVGATFDVYLTSAGSYAAAPASARAQLTVDADGFAVTGDLPYGTYTVHQTSGWAGSKLMEDFQVKIDENGKTYSYIINNQRFYSYLTVEKTDARTGEVIPAEGIGFKLYDPEGQQISWRGKDVWYSDAHGIVEFPMLLEYGEGYSVIEQNAPEGYILNPNPVYFDVKEENATIENELVIIRLQVENAPTQISLAKVDYAGSYVPGAKLELEAQRKRQAIPQHQDSSEMKHFPKELVALAKAQDVLDILRKAGEPLVEKDKQIRSAEHDSLVITPGKGFYWFSHGVGSKSPIDYFMWTKKLSFIEAARKVLLAMDVVHAPEQLQAPISQQEPAQRPFHVPAAAKDQGIAFSYLTEDRKLDKALVTELMQQGLILQADKYNSVVFLGKDYSGQVSSGFVRYSPAAPPQNGVWKMDLAGSQKGYRFRIEHTESRSVYVFESEIDLLSYLSMLPKEQRTENYISLGGVSPRALQSYLKHRPETQEIHICTDMDEAGEAAAKNITDVLGDIYKITRERSVHKDWNEDLVHSCTADHEREKRHSPAPVQRDALSMDSAMAKLNPIPAQQQVKLDLPRAHTEQWDY